MAIIIIIMRRKRRCGKGGGGDSGRRSPEQEEERKRKKINADELKKNKSKDVMRKYASEQSKNAYVVNKICSDKRN